MSWVKQMMRMIVVVGQSGMGTRVFASSIAGGPVWGVDAAAWAEAREVVSSGKHTLLYVCTCVEEFTYTKPHEP